MGPETSTRTAPTSTRVLRPDHSSAPCRQRPHTAPGRVSDFRFQRNGTVAHASPAVAPEAEKKNSECHLCNSLRASKIGKTRRRSIRNSTNPDSIILGRTQSAAACPRGDPFPRTGPLEAGGPRLTPARPGCTCRPEFSRPCAGGTCVPRLPDGARCRPRNCAPTPFNRRAPGSANGFLPAAEHAHSPSPLSREETREPTLDASRLRGVHRTPQARSARSRTCSPPEATAICGSRVPHGRFLVARPVLCRACRRHHSCPVRRGKHARLARLSCTVPVSVSTQATGNDLGRTGLVRQSAVKGSLLRIAHESRNSRCQRTADAAGRALDTASWYDFPLHRLAPAWPFRGQVLLGLKFPT